MRQRDQEKTLRPNHLNLEKPKKCGIFCCLGKRRKNKQLKELSTILREFIKDYTTFESQVLEGLSTKHQNYFSHNLHLFFGQNSQKVREHAKSMKLKSTIASSIPNYE